MPHLDEGALWVRATMPYTISFEEASKIAPQIRDILMSFPQVTVVGSELGRPDDGTDPTGFFNCEFYVGLKPYKDKSWTRQNQHKKELIESVNEKLTAFPGIIFNYTQPAEDAVDEALTGLKSSLAVKIYGDDLNVLQDKAVQIKNALGKVPGFTELTVVRELGQPSLLVDVDRDKIARYGINVADVEAVSPPPSADKRSRKSSRAKSCSIWSCVCSRNFAAARTRLATCWSGHPMASRFRSASSRILRRATARRSFTAKITLATSACSTASKAATWIVPS